MSCTASSTSWQRANIPRRIPDFRRFLTDRFSAQVFYEISDKERVIYGVFDCQEAPEQIALDLSMR